MVLNLFVIALTIVSARHNLEQDNEEAAVTTFTMRGVWRNTLRNWLPANLPSAKHSPEMIKINVQVEDYL